MTSFNKKFKIIFTKEQIQNGILSLAKKLDEVNDSNTVFLVLLNGALHFASDLFLNMKTSVTFDSVITTSQKNDIKTKIIYSNKISFESKKIIIIDDICDTGKTISSLIADLNESHNSIQDIKVVTLIWRSNVKNPFITPDYYIFNYEKDDFFYGYGFDYNNSLRNKPYIFSLK